MTYTAWDAGASNIGAGRANVPNNDAARNLFLAAIGATPTVEDFEDVVIGNYANFAGDGYFSGLGTATGQGNISLSFNEWYYD